MITNMGGMGGKIKATVFADLAAAVVVGIGANIEDQPFAMISRSRACMRLVIHGCAPDFPDSPDGGRVATDIDDIIVAIGKLTCFWPT